MLAMAMRAKRSAAAVSVRVRYGGLMPSRLSADAVRVAVSGRMSASFSKRTIPICASGISRQAVAEFWGTAPTGKSFRTMAIDVFTVRDGRLAKGYHVENWQTAIQQLTS